MSHSAVSMWPVCTWACLQGGEKARLRLCHVRQHVKCIVHRDASPNRNSSNQPPTMTRHWTSTPSKLNFITSFIVCVNITVLLNIMICLWEIGDFQSYLHGRTIFWPVPAQTGLSVWTLFIDRPFYSALSLCLHLAAAALFWSRYLVFSSFDLLTVTLNFWSVRIPTV